MRLRAVSLTVAALATSLVIAACGSPSNESPAASQQQVTPTATSAPATPDTPAAEESTAETTPYVSSASPVDEPTLATDPGKTKKPDDEPKPGEKGDVPEPPKDDNPPVPKPVEKPPARANVQAGFVDPGCTHTKISFNHLMGTYALREGGGLTGWRLSANLDVYDLCDHGGIYGSVHVYDANVTAKGGQVYLANASCKYCGVAYNRSAISGWQYDNPKTYNWTRSGGWNTFYVNTDNNIGMSRGTWFDYIKVSNYIVFDNVPASPRRTTCARQTNNTWDCKDHMGL